MVPRIAKRGHSFLGAAKYYLHDKQSVTNERVMWTHTHNLPTDDADKAFGWMAYTAMNADQLKHRSGVSKVGRKSSAGVVYSYSLAWHPEQKPNRETMQSAALEVLESLGLEEHEAVLVAHNDRMHSHVHVVCNLVHPFSGKTIVPSYDYLTASTWAENFERKEQKIRCEQRVINNEKRRQAGFHSGQSKIVKHREKRLEDAQLIQKLYQNAATSLQFQKQLANEGFTLCKGDRRGLVLVDRHGKISSLSRQLKGQRAKDIRERLKDLRELPRATQVVEQVQQKQGLKTEMLNQKNQLSKQNATENSLEIDTKTSELSLKRLDAERIWEQQRARKKYQLEKTQKELYQRKALVKKIKSLEEALLSKKRKGDLQGQLEALKKNLENIDMRIEEQNQQFEKESQETKPNINKEEHEKSEKQKMIDYIKKQQEQKKNAHQKGNNNRLKR